VNVELGKAATTTISLNDSVVRNLAGIQSGAISLFNLYGKSNSTGSTHTLVAGTNGYGTGYVYPPFGLIGSLSPDTFKGLTVVDLYTSAMGNGTNLYYLEFTILGLVAQNFFTSILYAGTTVYSSSSTYYQYESLTVWSWTTSQIPLFNNGSSYQISIS